MQRTITVAASGVYVERIKGKVFAVISTTAAFDVELDNGGKQSMVAGRKLSGDKFKRITIFETTGAEVTITFYAGDDDINVSSPPTGTSGLSTIIGNDLASCVNASVAQFQKTSTAAADPVALKAASTKFRKAILYGLSAEDGTANTSSVFVGANSAADKQPIEILPGGEYVLEPPSGSKWDFADFYLAVETDNDGLVVIFT